MHIQITRPMKWQDFYINQSNLYISRFKVALSGASPQKHQTLEILTKVDFYTFFLKISHISRFLKFINSLCKNCCMHFILLEVDSLNRIELDSSIL